MVVLKLDELFGGPDGLFMPCINSLVQLVRTDGQSNMPDALSVL